MTACYCASTYEHGGHFVFGGSIGNGMHVLTIVAKLVYYYYYVCVYEERKNTNLKTLWL